MRRTILFFAVALVLAACGGGTQDDGRTPVPAQEPALGHYEGPSVSFDYPNGWHEYLLSPAAYAPVSGGDGEFVTVIPAPPETKGMTLEDFVKWSTPTEAIRLAGPTETVDVNGLRGYLVPVALTGPNGQALDRRLILVKGERGDYLITCQYGRQVEAQVLAGCETLMDTLVEVPPPVTTDRSDCTDTELALLSSVPMPEEANLKKPRGETEEGQHYRDLMAFLPSGYDGDVVDYFRPRMTEAGWDSEEAKMVRTFESYDVWQIIATRDWDVYMVEVYVEDGHAHHFFISVVDG